MSRDFILIFSGGMVSLVTTLVVLFVSDYFSRRAQTTKVDSKETQQHPAHAPESIKATPVKEDQTV